MARGYKNYLSFVPLLIKREPLFRYLGYLLPLVIAAILAGYYNANNPAQ